MKNNKTIIVSGCTKGIGRAICKLFAGEGFNVAGYARNKNDIEEMNHSFSKQFPQQTFLFMSADASIKDNVLNFAEQVKSTFGTIEIIVNNAGVFIPGDLINEADGVIEKLINTNVYSAYYLTRALLLNLIEQKNGYVFNMCSVASLKAYEHGGSYSISKFALLGFSKQLREELKPHHIKVTAIMPGATLTESWSGSDLPESRFIKADDVAKTILSIYQLSDYTDVEEIVIRPQLGDL